MKKSSDDFYPQSEINIEFCIKGENINPADITKIIEIVIIKILFFLGIIFSSSYVYVL